jgi:hypothetical protein
LSISPKKPTQFHDLSLIPSSANIAEIAWAFEVFITDYYDICEKNSTDEIFSKINSFDHRLKFKIEKMQNNEIQFLDALIFIENSEIKFKKHDVSPLKYKHNIFTSLHRTRDFCSDNEQFEKCLDDLRIIILS